MPLNWNFECKEYKLEKTYAWRGSQRVLAWVFQYLGYSMKSIHAIFMHGTQIINRLTQSTMIIHDFQTAAFAGYPSEKLIRTVKSQNDLDILYNKIFELLERLYDDGYSNFISSMGIGFDTIAVKAVCDLRKLHHEIVLVAAIPFVGHEAEWPEAEQVAYANMIAQADHIEIVCMESNPRAVHYCNIWILRHSSHIICFKSDMSDEWCIEAIAKRMGKNITNIADKI